MDNDSNNPIRFTLQNMTKGGSILVDDSAHAERIVSRLKARGIHDAFVLNLSDGTGMGMTRWL